MADGNLYVAIVCLKWIFTLYHGKSPLNHHLENIFLFFPTTQQTKSKQLSSIHSPLQTAYV